MQFLLPNVYVSKRNTRVFVLQLQPEQDGQEHSRRFRLENGDSPGEKDEVFISKLTHTNKILYEPA